MDDSANIRTGPAVRPGARVHDLAVHDGEDDGHLRDVAGVGGEHLNANVVGAGGVMLANTISDYIEITPGEALLIHRRMARGGPPCVSSVCVLKRFQLL